MEVLVRIKRMGDAWSTCGIGVRHLAPKGTPKNVCPKLVPGQVLKIETEGNNFAQQPHIEIVQKPEHDEFIRPLVFANEQEAFRANPSNGELTEDDFAMGQAMVQTALQAKQRELQDRLEARGEDPNYQDFDTPEFVPEIDELSALAGTPEFTEDPMKDVNEERAAKGLTAEQALEEDEPAPRPRRSRARKRS